MARLCPLFSGSSGNSYYIGSRSSGVLIDAGRSARQTEGMLGVCGIDPMAIQAIFITHEHSDHVAGVRVFARKYGLPVYGSAGTMAALEEALYDVETRIIESDLEVSGMAVHAFAVSHDCAQPTGYRVRTEDERVFTLATDLGVLTDEVRENLIGADCVVLEANHDLEMLRTGPYPRYLKERILSGRGHLSNDACAGFLPQLLKSGTRRFILGHLSRENNTPTLAKNAALAALSREGYVEEEDFILQVARAENAGGKHILF